MKDDDFNWLDSAACKGVAVDKFYVPEGNVQRSIRMLCDACAVKSECLEDALTVSLRDDFGYRGGTSVKQRKEIRKQRILDGTWNPIQLQWDNVLERFYRV